LNLRIYKEGTVLKTRSEREKTGKEKGKDEGKEKKMAKTKKKGEEN